MRQEDVAAQVAAHGWQGWDRDRVAAIELGRRTLRFDELLIFATVVNRTVVQLIPSEPDAWLEVAGQRVSAGLVRTILCEGPARLDLSARSLPAPPTESERKASRRLGVGVPRLVIAAERLWGRRLDAERDRRAAEAQPAAADPAALQRVRGHITRRLVEELEQALREEG
jgi:hypothetical protein